MNRQWCPMLLWDPAPSPPWPMLCLLVASRPCPAVYTDPVLHPGAAPRSNPPTASGLPSGPGLPGSLAAPAYPLLCGGQRVEGRGSKVEGRVPVRESQDSDWEHTLRTREGLDTGTQLWLCQALFWPGRCRVGGWGLRPRVQVAWLGAKGVLVGSEMAERGG